VNSSPLTPSARSACLVYIAILPINRLRLTGIFDVWSALLCPDGA
jgi:hypothetical protein